MISTFDLIVVTADEPYHGMAHTQILYTNFFAKQRPVLYVEAPHKWRPWNILISFRNPTQQHSNLFLHTYINALPSKLKLGKIINERLNAFVIARFLKKRSAKNTLIWHFDSYRSVLNSAAMQAQSSLQHIYHVIDPFYNNPVDAQLRAISKVVVVTSPRNVSFYENVKSKVLQVPQCVDLEIECGYLKEPSAINAHKKEYLVLLGTISDDCDFDLLQKLVESGQKLMVIGKLAQLRKKNKQLACLLGHENVSYLGFLRPKEFYPYLQKAKLGIIAYDLSLRNRSFSTLKAINYLIAGLNVISNCDTEIDTLKNIAVFEEKNPENFLKICSRSNTSLLFDAPAVENYLKSKSLSAACVKILTHII